MALKLSSVPGATGEEGVLSAAVGVTVVIVDVVAGKDVEVRTGFDGLSATVVPGVREERGVEKEVGVAVGLSLAAWGTRKIKKTTTRTAAVTMAQVSQLPVANSVASS